MPLQLAMVGGLRACDLTRRVTLLGLAEAAGLARCRRPGRAVASGLGRRCQGAPAWPRGANGAGWSLLRKGRACMLQDMVQRAPPL